MVNPILLLKNTKKVLISRTDNIGDVVLTLPLAFYIKKYFPQIELYFLCKNYTKAILDCTSVFTEIWTVEDFTKKEIEEIKKINIDVVINVFPDKKLAILFKKCKIPYRIGTSHRLFHLYTCNKRVNFTRKKSDLHEAQLNFKLLKPLITCSIPSIEFLNTLLINNFTPKNNLSFSKNEFVTDAIVIHPKSNASAVEYPIEKYIDLANKLVEKGEKVVFTGTEKEALHFRALLPKHKNIIDYSGKFNLEDFIYFLSKQKALIACSTGPYHLAGILGIKSIALFSAQIPIHPGRWKALGNKSDYIQYDVNCKSCKLKARCFCIKKITVEEIIKRLALVN